MKKLKEVVKIVGLSRRAIQEYEVRGLSSKPTETNAYGHLLYDDKQIERLFRLRLYKELGYQREEIIKLESDPDFSNETELGRIIEKLEEKQRDLDSLINIAKKLYI